MTARIREDIFLWDPFCGSGTISIEGAMIATRRAPGLNRHFSGEGLQALPPCSWQEARDEATLAIISDSAYRGYGTDIDSECIETAKLNAKRAGVYNHIKFFVADAQRIRKPEFECKGSIICNPPYGERMMSMRDAENLYRNIGRCFSQFDPWQIYVLTSCEYFEKLYGRRADKVRKLYNGTIPAFLYQFYKPKNR
jgi:putative N6-adenine-specific DNA methylase